MSPSAAIKLLRRVRKAPTRTRDAIRTTIGTPLGELPPAKRQNHLGTSGYEFLS